jgi:hypothetical protein
VANEILEEKSMPSSSVEQYLKEIQIPLRLSCVSTSGWPIVLSLWYLFEDGNLYCATPQQAKVVNYLKQTPRCGFEVAADRPPYCGVRGRALASIEAERGTEILERLLIRYAGGTDNPLARKLLGRRESEVAIRLTPKSTYVWNFTRRMKGSLDSSTQKLCPE